ncbi:hypothetical protein EXD82_01100 [Peptacetobacter hominis]|uniref:Integrase catalytic domain-containing protein n=1 Tax=Peptacetobacter hominis TaxID=2743610 RepID=A0A544QYR8_9FIRM|nr:hypothetical protein EXD82_01100 [Peptacetobacter hominis]
MFYGHKNTFKTLEELKVSIEDYIKHYNT